MKNWIIIYQDANGNENKARVAADKYGEALTKGEKVIVEFK